MKKRVLTYLGIVCLSLCLINILPCTSYAASSGTCGDNLTWTLDDNGLLTISGTGAMKDFELYSSGSISYYAPWYDVQKGECPEVKSINIAPGVTHIGQGAFLGCKNIDSITIPDSVNSIGSSAFTNCSNMISIKLPDSLTTLNDSFFNCNNLENIIVTSKNSHFASIDGILFNKDISTLIRYPAGKKSTSYSIPKSVVSVSSYAFNGCTNLLNIEIPDVNYFGYRVFEGCTNLTQIEYPNCVTTFDFYEIMGCSNATILILPKSITTIAPYSYPPTNLKYIYYKGSQSDWEQLIASNSNLDNTLANITVIYDYSNEFYWYIENGTLKINVNGNMPVWDSPLTTPWSSMRDDIYGVEISGDATNISAFAFTDCKNLHTVSLPDTINNIEKSAFRNTGIISLSIPDNVTTISANAFRDCIYLENITLPNNIGCIEKYTFSNCESLKSIIIPNGVGSIENGAFSCCENLVELDLPRTVTNIGNAAFTGCTELTKVNYSGSNRNWSNITIGKENFYLTDADINFDVIDGDEMNTEISDVSLTDATVTVTVKNIPSDSKIFATTYNIDGQFTKLYMLDVSGNTATAKISATDIKQIKVFAWKDFETLIPLCDTKNITISK